MSDEIRPTLYRADEIERAAEWLRAGGLLVFPTETFYGLGADPRCAATVARLREIKDRPREEGLPLLAGNREQVSTSAPDWERRRVASKLADGFWPGPLTLVVRSSASIPEGVAAADRSIAIRVSSDLTAARLARLVGHPLVATSANRRGGRPQMRALAAWRALDRADEIHVLEDGETRGEAASTIVDVRRSRARIVRAGAIDRESIEAVLGDELEVVP